MVETEHQLGAVRPDVALLDAEGKVLRVVEIVVTHEPDEVAWDTYSANGIPTFCVRVDGKGAAEFFQGLGVAPPVLQSVRASVPCAQVPDLLARVGGAGTGVGEELPVLAVQQTHDGRVLGSGWQRHMGVG